MTKPRGFNLALLEREKEEGGREREREKEIPLNLAGSLHYY